MACPDPLDRAVASGQQSLSFDSDPVAHGPTAPGRSGSHRVYDNSPVGGGGHRSLESCGRVMVQLSRVRPASPLRGAPLLSVLMVAEAAASPPDRITLYECLALVGAWIVATDDHPDMDQIKEMARFVHAAEVYDVVYLDQVSQKLVTRFMNGPTKKGKGHAHPRGNTSNNRLKAVRALLKVCRQIQLCANDWDPTVDIASPKRTRLLGRPVTDTEMAYCEAVAAGGFTTDRRAATLALVQAGATNSELLKLTLADVDFEDGTVRLPGSTHLKARTNPLTPWGLEALRLRAAQVPERDADQPLLVPAGTTPGVAAASLSNSLARILYQAGLKGDPGVTVRSLHAWGALRVYQATSHTDRVVAACDFLGWTDLNKTLAFLQLSGVDDGTDA